MTMQRIMKSTADFFEGEIEDGDVLMCNLAYLGNTTWASRCWRARCSTKAS